MLQSPLGGTAHSQHMDFKLKNQDVHHVSYNLNVFPNTV